ncbi:MAG TPA: HAD-IC family P-type ATPase [Candidatus Paceibacterota bacterium]|nr:HAD-IC family P-type ATPase [Candidatus Paceibacterota bacterium]
MDLSWWHSTEPEAIERTFGTGKQGLSAEEAKKRLASATPNILPTKPPDSVFAIFLRQFASPLIYILLGAAVIIYITEGHVDAYIIFALVLFNAVVGTIQEGRAQNTLAALKSYAEAEATVLRDGKTLLVPDAEVVPGDVILLAEGGKVAADARIISARGVRVDESALTGESVPVDKTADTLPGGERVIGDQTNMVFKGTNIVAGAGQAIVVATGIDTVIGRIAKELAADATEIPLQATIRRLSHAIILVVLVISALIFGIGLALGNPPASMFATVVALAVSIIPEGLPIVLTLVLASGVWRMSKRNALVKNLQAVEALGQASVIAVDKTGTITKNEMIVEQVYAEGSLFLVGGSGYEPVGELSLDGTPVVPANHPELLSAGRIATYTATARTAYDEEKKLWRVLGDPTEAALVVLARKLGFEKEALERESPVEAELPFSSELRYHAAVHGGSRGGTLSVTGAPELILAKASHVREKGRTHALSAEKRHTLENLMLDLSRKGLRVLAYAERPGMTRALSPEHVTDLTFLGFYAMKDGLKPEVASALARARGAGMRVVMITGDHVVTARAIAQEAGICREGDRVLTGAEMDELTDAGLRDILPDISVFARVTPDHKLRIIHAYRALGLIVAMTGDGINDAPSLVAADLGVAMGKIGTEVAKEAADIILLDDDFGSIVSAIEEGRGIYASIRRVTLYLFSTSAGETLAIMGALVASYPLPVLPAQIIWLNFVTDGFLDIALAMEPKEKDILKKKFRKPGRYLFDSTMTVRMLLMATVMAGMTVWIFGQHLPEGLPKALTISFTFLAVIQWFNAWNCRSEDRSIFSMNPLGNPYLIGATVIVVGLQLFAVYHPFGQALLRTVPLSAADWQIILLAATPIVLIEEVRKALIRLLAGSPKPPSINTDFTARRGVWVDA